MVAKKVAKKTAKKTVKKTAAKKSPIKKVAKKAVNKAPGKISRAAKSLGLMAKEHGLPLLKKHARAIARIGIGELQKRVKNPSLKKGLSEIRKVL